MRLVDKYFGKIIWILTGICFAAAGSLMWISGSFDLNRFYHAGEVYDVSKSNLKLSGNYDVDYNAEEHVFTVQSEVASKVFVISEGKWKYIYLSASQAGEDGIDVSLVCYNTDNTVVYEADIRISEGDNLFTVPDVRYSRINLNFLQKEGASFGIDQIQFRTTPPIFSRSRFFKYFLFLFVCFLLASGSVFLVFRKKLRKWSWYAPLEELQKLFLYIGTAGERFDRICSDRTKRRIRSGLFCFIILFMQAVFIRKMYFSRNTYRFVVLVCMAALTAIALLCWERPLQKLNWKNKLSVSWLWLWILAAISNFIVEKRFAYTGAGMLLIVGFLFFMWGNMQRREELLGDFIRGILWSFYPNLIFAYLFRPYLPAYRYMGSSYSPGIYALYLLFVWIAFLSRLDFDIWKKKVLGKDLFYIFMLGICANLLWKTQSISSIVPAALAALIFSFKLWKNRKQVKLIGIMLYLVLFGVGYSANAYGIYYIPRMVNAEVKFTNDRYQDTVTDHPFLITVKASEGITANRILYKLKTSASLEELTTGRTLFWKAYLRELNLWGHKKHAEFMGSTHMPHNGFVAIMYWYGIFAIVPYLVMVCYQLWYAVRYFKRHIREKTYSFFVLSNAVACTLLLFVENVEIPFGWLCWYCMYLVMGLYFDDEQECREWTGKTPGGGEEF